MTITKTTNVSIRLNNSLSISDRGKNNEGIFKDLISPEEPTIFPTLWLVTLEKKNHNIRPEVANSI